ncbi:CDP-diacylglycerol--serine O-phosphatidyltransferase [Allostella vacuolata]|nr:CDP-diacylglycerol--serine O-phosphatidyltransferase [Stella vacuolata]
MKLHSRLRRRNPGRLRALPINRLIPNALTVLALSAGVTALRFGLEGRWGHAVGMIILAAVFDALDGRIARLIGGTSGFGAQLDSLSDVIAFGLVPGMLVHQFAMKGIAGFGWIVALVYITCCALRLARFNTKLNDPDMPPWAYNYFNGVPAPAGAGLALLPMILAQQFPDAFFANAWLNAIWLLFVAGLMISSVPTYAAKKTRVPQAQVPLLLLGVGVVAAAAVSEPWLTLAAIALVYVGFIPFSIRSYSRLAAEATRMKAEREGTLVSLADDREGAGR